MNEVIFVNPDTFVRIEKAVGVRAVYYEQPVRCLMFKDKNGFERFVAPLPAANSPVDAILALLEASFR